LIQLKKAPLLILVAKVPIATLIKLSELGTFSVIVTRFAE
jgi:hypothetical protein